jgi:hypothetical protein
VAHLLQPRDAPAVRPAPHTAPRAEIRGVANEEQRKGNRRGACFTPLRGRLLHGPAGGPDKKLVAAQKNDGFVPQTQYVNLIIVGQSE